MRIADRIKQIRHECVLSLEDVAARAGLAKRLIARLENGQEVPTLEMLDNLADALGVPVYRFFFDDVEFVRTPKLTPGMTLKELIERCQQRAERAQLSKSKNPVAAVMRAFPDRAARPPGTEQVTRESVSPKFQSTGMMRAGAPRGSQVPERKL